MRKSKVKPFDTKKPTNHPDEMFVGWKVRISPTQEVRVTRFVLNGKEYIGLRFWRNYRNEGFMFPTQQGIYLEPHMVQAGLIPALKDALEGVPENAGQVEFTERKED